MAILEGVDSYHKYQLPIHQCVHRVIGSLNIVAVLHAAEEQLFLFTVEFIHQLRIFKIHFPKLSSPICHLLVEQIDVHLAVLPHSKDPVNAHSYQVD